MQVNFVQIMQSFLQNKTATVLRMIYMCEQVDSIFFLKDCCLEAVHKEILQTQMLGLMLPGSKMI